ncbi:MAG: GNAT family N-acetyltransferase [Ruminococcus sp.]|nr:GNAT family N-acetyltransferase [Ruminococcus sp.]
MELWDAYNKDFEKIDGVTLVRGEEDSIPRGVYHLVCHVLVRHTDGTYLLMRRDPRKAYPDMWEATAGGSALKGESPLDCARRELTEETGIVSEQLTEFGRFARDDTRSAYVDYLCVTDCDKDSVALQEGETTAYRWVTREELLSMDKTELLSEGNRVYIGRSTPSDEVTVREERLTAEEYIRFLRRTDLGSQYPRERFAERIARLVNTASISLVARNSIGTVVGVLFGLTDYAYWLYVTDLGVDRAYERRGLGSRLMQTAHELAGGEKDIAVYLIANENAVPFYKKLGMKYSDDVMQYNHIEWTGFTVGDEQ